MKKIVVVGIVLLFIALAIAPSINANAVEDDLVELEVEFCGIGNKHSVKLTQQEVDEIALLFDDIEDRVSKVETREEANDVFKKAIFQLNAYGLLEDVTVQQAERLIIGSELRQRVLDRIDEKVQIGNSNTNYLCLIIGGLTNSYFYNPLALPFSILLLKYLDWTYDHGLFLLFAIGDIIWLFGDPIRLGIAGATSYFPISLFSTITASYAYPRPPLPYKNVRSYGGVCSFGTNGKKIWEGKLKGNVSNSFIHIEGTISYPGCLGFQGIKVYIDSEEVTLFLGFAFKASFINV